MRAILHTTNSNRRVDYRPSFHNPPIFRGIGGSATCKSLGPSIAPRLLGKRYTPRRCRLGFARTTATKSNRVLGDPLLWLGFAAFAASPPKSPKSVSFSCFALFP